MHVCTLRWHSWNDNLDLLLLSSFTLLYPIRTFWLLYYFSISHSISRNINTAFQLGWKLPSLKFPQLKALCSLCVWANLSSTLIICISSENITPEEVFRLSYTSFPKNTRSPPPARNKVSKLYYHSKRSITRNTSAKNVHLGKESELWISSAMLHHVMQQAAMKQVYSATQFSEEITTCLPLSLCHACENSWSSNSF